MDIKSIILEAVRKNYTVKDGAFYRVTQREPYDHEESLLDAHLNTNPKYPMPDIDMKHYEIKLGKFTHEGWGVKSDKDNIGWLDRINTHRLLAGYHPFNSVEHHILYSPVRHIIHLSNDRGEEAGITDGNAFSWVGRADIHIPNKPEHRRLALDGDLGYRNLYKIWPPKSKEEKHAVFDEILKDHVDIIPFNVTRHIAEYGNDNHHDILIKSANHKVRHIVAYQGSRKHIEALVNDPHQTVSRCAKATLNMMDKYPDEH